MLDMRQGSTATRAGHQFIGGRASKMASIGHGRSGDGARKGRTWPSWLVAGMPGGAGVRWSYTNNTTEEGDGLENARAELEPVTTS